MTDTSGTMVYSWPWQNNAFGDLPSTGAANFYMRFPGQYYDVETGLHYNGARYYDPATGRFPQPDLSGMEGGIGLYVYGLDNPLLYFDPDGLAATLPALGTSRFQAIIQAKLNCSTKARSRSRPAKTTDIKGDNCL